jgi:3-oxoadipate enol-lactonase
VALLLNKHHQLATNMKTFIINLLLLIAFQINAQNTTSVMEKLYIKTKIGNIAVFKKEVQSDKTPIIFLHGVYFDHHLWDNQIAQITDRTVFAIDMPWHGESTENIHKNWDLNDCSAMLLEILDSLKTAKIIAIGHSWGSMTILRAAAKNSEKFASVGLCNTPFEAASFGSKIGFSMQHSALLFKKFYIKQAAKSLFGKQSLKDNPALFEMLYQSMSKLSGKQIRKTDRFVILKAENTISLIENLKIPALALKGKDDYVPMPPKNIETSIVKGGHVSPIEAIKEVNEFCKKVIENEKI